ncbi:MAG: D-alanine--D-alanine ligase [Simkaniaceae bacterium]|nr:D-alanine--D-alanine ligase [Candidatus Sacchlamyda saccharinae]
MTNKINVAVLFGGRSVEHKVSLQSAKNVVENIDREKHNVMLIGIDPNGKWHFYDEQSYLFNEDNPEAISLGKSIREVDLRKESIDVVFPVLHGTFGEDGTVQGLLRLYDLPFVGAGVLGSAVGMDKDVAKRLIRDAGIATPNFLAIEEHNISYEKVQEMLTPPYFIKPARSGSSIGINKATNEQEFISALDSAFTFDRKVLIEEAIAGVELQFALLGNKVSLPCQIIPKAEMHSYASKYLDPDGAEWLIPAPLSDKLLSSAQEMALKAYQVLCCGGMARVDLFLSEEGELYFNEINTLPGLTRQSPYAKMWEATGVSFTDVLDRLIQLALDRHKKDGRLNTHLEDSGLLSGGFSIAP